MAQFDMDLVSLRERVIHIDAELASKGRKEGGMGVDSWSWAPIKARLMKEKATIVAQLQSLRALERERNMRESAVSRSQYDRVRVLLGACYSIAKNVEDLDGAERATLDSVREFIEHGSNAQRRES